MVQEIVVGTRGSDLALAQTRLLSEALEPARPGVRLIPSIIKTSGDEGAPERALSPAGRKGLFTAEIERALLRGKIDAAVHSAKDLPSTLADGTEIAAVLPRALVTDVLVSRGAGYDLESLPCGGMVATGSIRRSHQIRWKRPDLRITALRGNVPTRLRKLAAASWDGAVLALAGLQRLNLLTNESSIQLDGETFSLSVLDPETFAPAGGQGIIAVQTRKDDRRVRDVMSAADDRTTHACLRAEREFLRLLDVDCNCPVGVYAQVKGEVMRVRGQFFQDGASAPKEAVVDGSVSDPEALASKLYERIHG